MFNHGSRGCEAVPLHMIVRRFYGDKIMPQHALRFNGGIVHYGSNDAIFRHIDGRPIAMEFHRYCGPMFTLDENDGGYMPKEDTPEWESLWVQFYGWWSAKGKTLYTA